MLLGTATLLCLASCDDDCPQVDTQSPRLTVTSPQEGQAYKNGDTIRIEMKGRDGESVFGAIAQQVAPQVAPRRAVAID